MSYKDFAGPQKGILREVPKESYIRSGFGRCPIGRNEWDRWIESVTNVRQYLSSGFLPENDNAIQLQFSDVKGLFSRIRNGDQRDWFTTSKLLGHPGADLSYEMSKRMSSAKHAMKTRDYGLFDEMRTRFENDHGFEMLSNYIDMAVNAAHPLDERGWAYILWSSSERDALHVGAASGQIEDVTKRLERERRGGNPYGVMAAWLVHDVVDAYQSIHKALDLHKLGDGFFRVNLGEAKDKVGDVLKATCNMAHSPWHADQELPQPILIEREQGRGYRLS